MGRLDGLQVGAVFRRQEVVPLHHQAAVAAEETRPVHSEFRVAVRIEDMAGLTLHGRAADAAHRVGGEEVITAALLRGRQAAVQVADGVGEVGDLQREVGEALHLLCGQLLRPTVQTHEGGVELLECGLLVEEAGIRLAALRHIVGAGAVAPPVHGAMVGHTAQALGGHGTLQGLEGLELGIGEERWRSEGAWVGQGLGVRIPQVPGQAVEVAEDVAAAAGRGAVARGQASIVEVGPALHHAGGFGIGQVQVVRLHPARRVDDGDPVVEAGQHVESLPGLVERQAGGPAAADLDVVVGVGNEGVVLQLGGRQDRYLGGAEGRQVEGVAVAAESHLHGPRQAAFAHRVGDRIAAPGEVHVLVEVPRMHAVGVEHRDAHLVDVAAHRAVGECSRTFEADLVAGLGVGDIDGAGGGVDRQVEEHGSDAAE